MTQKKAFERAKALLEKLAKRAADEAESLPCKLLGHDWWEIPKAFRQGRWRNPDQIQFKCRRCTVLSSVPDIEVAGRFSIVKPERRA